MTRKAIQIASVENADKRLTEISNLSFAITAKAGYYNGLVTGFKDGYKQGDVEGFKQGYLVAIRRACKWIKKNVHKDLVIYNDKSWKRVNEFINDFEKDIQEQL